ncbi:50S ribosomal protein L15, partial [Candidatus Sumerlaeota bacterium]|nr:50S ribosomal protein L15 [Candidatus Sumerlaeota bacterium]
MIRIENLPGDRGRRQKPTRKGRGRGTGKGQTAGRGNKGFHARTGSGKRPGDEGGQTPLVQRLPKRGFHPLARIRYSPVNLNQIEKRFEAGAEVGAETLRAARLVRKKSAPIKILATGDLTKPLVVRAHAFSRAAREKIVQAGGSVEV